MDHACNPLLDRPFHPYACQAAIYARCAQQQNRYWPFEELLFENRERLEARQLQAYAKKAGLDTQALAQCVKKPSTLEAITKDIQLGLERKLQGTPTFFVNGQPIVGLKDDSFWQKKIQSLLKEKGKS
jgi:protein-disulfide isomerase